MAHREHLPRAQRVGGLDKNAQGGGAEEGDLAEIDLPHALGERVVQDRAETVGVGGVQLSGKVEATVTTDSGERDVLDQGGCGPPAARQLRWTLSVEVVAQDAEGGSAAQGGEVAFVGQRAGWLGCE